jgi:hypothetical protein
VRLKRAEDTTFLDLRAALLGLRRQRQVPWPLLPRLALQPSEVLVQALVHDFADDTSDDRADGRLTEGAADHRPGGGQRVLPVAL